MCACVCMCACACVLVRARGTLATASCACRLDPTRVLEPLVRGQPQGLHPVAIPWRYRLIRLCVHTCKHRLSCTQAQAVMHASTGCHARKHRLSCAQAQAVMHASTGCHARKHRLSCTQAQAVMRASTGCHARKHRLSCTQAQAAMRARPPRIPHPRMWPGGSRSQCGALPTIPDHDHTGYARSGP